MTAHDPNDAPAMVAYTLDSMVTLAGQPQPADWARLAADGYATVLNIRSDAQRAAAQAHSAEQAGLRYIYLPLPAYQLEPEHLARFATTIEQPGRGRLLLHCRSATRAALLWMLYRISQQGWELAEAQAELRTAGYSDDAIEALTYCVDDYVERAGAELPSTS